MDWFHFWNIVFLAHWSYMSLISFTFGVLFSWSYCTYTIHR